MGYGIRWIIRFQGTLTQGPNAGRSYTYDTSWGGVQFDSESAARAKLREYAQREPGLRYKVLSRQWRGGGFEETEVVA
jgi:hypothetical protein